MQSQPIKTYLVFNHAVMWTSEIPLWAELPEQKSSYIKKKNNMRKDKSPVTVSYIGEKTYKQKNKT